MCVDILRRYCPNTQKFVGAHASGLAVCTYYTMWCKLELCLLLIIFQLSKSKELGRDMSLKLVDDFEEKCRKKINTSSLEFGPKEFDEGRIRLCCYCALIMSFGVSLTCTDFKTFLKHAQQELQRVFNTACGFSNAQEVVHRQKAAMRTKVNVLRMHAHSLCYGQGKLPDSHIAGTCHSTFAAATMQACRQGGDIRRGCSN